jgi:hypothetical protein
VGGTDASGWTASGRRADEKCRQRHDRGCCGGPGYPYFPRTSYRGFGRQGRGASRPTVWSSFRIENLSPPTTCRAPGGDGEEGLGVRPNPTELDTYGTVTGQKLTSSHGTKPHAFPGKTPKTSVFADSKTRTAFVLIIPWSCVRITPGLVRFGSVISSADGSSGGAASTPPEVALFAKLLANGPANTRWRASNAAQAASAFARASVPT